MAESDIRIGVNLLTCSLAHCPLHAQAMQWCLESLLDSDLQAWDWRLVVVDNGSNCPKTIQYLQELEAREDRVQVEWADVNLGIGKGRNLGYQVLQEWHAPHYAVEIHTDHVFPPPESVPNGSAWLTPIVRHMEHVRHETAGIVGASLVTAGGQWGSAKMAYPNCPCPDCLGFRRKGALTYEEFRANFARVAGAVRDRNNRVAPGLSHPVVKRWAMLEQIGFVRDGLLHCYDPDMPGLQNFEDTDEVLRAHKAGWQVLIHFGSVAYHHYHQTRLDMRDARGRQLNATGYDANNVYCQEKWRQEWPDFMQIYSDWMEKAYGR